MLCHGGTAGTLPNVPPCTGRPLKMKTLQMKLGIRLYYGSMDTRSHYELLHDYLSYNRAIVIMQECQRYILKSDYVGICPYLGFPNEGMIGWHHGRDGIEFEQALGDGDGQGSLACWSPWGGKESDMTE